MGDPWKPFAGWRDVLAHPDAPLGGGGPGRFRNTQLNPSYRLAPPGSRAEDLVGPDTPPRLLGYKLDALQLSIFGSEPPKSETAAQTKEEPADIEALVRAFASDMTAEAEKLRTARLAEEKKKADAASAPAATSSATATAGATSVPGATPAQAGASPSGTAPSKPQEKKATAKPPAIPVVTFSLSGNAISKERTPEQQAELLIDRSTKVCWSAHMANQARHVLMRVDGKYSDDLKKAFGKDFGAFKKKWADLMLKHGLKNAAGKDGYPTWDEFHLELPEGKVDRTDDRAQACLDEYVRLTREEDRTKNVTFEKKYSKLLKPHIKKYEKKQEAAKKKQEAATKK